MGSRSKLRSSSNIEDEAEPNIAFSRDHSIANSVERRSSIYQKKGIPESERAYANIRSLKVKIPIPSEKELHQKNIEPRNNGEVRIRKKDSSSNNLSKTNTSKNETAEVKNPFFYRVKDKVRRSSINTDMRADTVADKTLLVTQNPSELNSNLLNSNSSSTQIPKKSQERKSKGKQVLFESLKEISQDNLNDVENSKRSYKQSSKGLAPEKQSNTQFETTPSYLDYPMFFKEASNEYRLFLTGQIIVQIFLEILAESPEALFEPLSSAYESIEEEVSTHFHTYVYLKHLANIKHNFLRQLEQQGIVRSSSNKQEIDPANNDDGSVSPSSNFYQKKSEKLTELNLANVRSIARINGLHSIIIQACDCSQNLTSVNKLDAQMILIERLTTEKKLLSEKDISLQKIKELEQQLDLNSCDPLFNFSKFLRERAPSMDPQKLEVIEYLAEHIILLKNFAPRSKLAIMNCQREFDFVECNDHILDRLTSLVRILIDIFKLKFNLIQSFLFSLDRYLNNRQRNISAKHREKLILNIEKYSTTEQVVNNRARREKFQTIIKQLNHQKSGYGSQLEIPGGRDNKENGEVVGQRFLRNTNQDNTLVRSHFETILREHSLNKSLNITKGRERMEVVMEKVEKSAIMMNKEMSFNFQMLQRLKHSNLIRPNKDPPEEDTAN